MVNWPALEGYWPEFRAGWSWTNYTILKLKLRIWKTGTVYSWVSGSTLLSVMGNSIQMGLRKKKEINSLQYLKILKLELASNPATFGSSKISSRPGDSVSCLRFLLCQLHTQADQLHMGAEWRPGAPGLHIFLMKNRTPLSSHLTVGPDCVIWPSLSLCLNQQCSGYPHAHDGAIMVSTVLKWHGQTVGKTLFPQREIVCYYQDMEEGMLDRKCLVPIPTLLGLLSIQ